MFVFVNHFRAEPKLKRKRKNDDEDDVEEKYENETSNTVVKNTRTRMLLPIKSKDGLIERHMTVNDEENYNEKDKFEIRREEESDRLGSGDEDGTSDQELNLEYIVRKGRILLKVNYF